MIVRTSDRRTMVTPWFLLFAICSLVSSPNVAASNVYVRANQLGYQPRDAKSGIIFGESLPPKFDLVSTDTHKVVFSGNPRKIEGKWGAWHNFAELDFSAFNKPGHYLLRAAQAE